MNRIKPSISIIGAGVMGLTAAYALRNTGTLQIHDTAKNKNASLMAGGMLAPDSEIEHLPAAYRPAAEFSMNLWETLLQGAEIYHRHGTIIAAHAEDAHILQRLSGKLKFLKTWRAIDKSELQTLEPALQKFSSALYVREEAHLEPRRALDHLAAQVPPIKHEYIHDITKTKSDWVIDCRGHGACADDPDLRGVKGEAILVRNPEFSLARPVRLLHPRYPLYIVPRADHVFMIGATVIEGTGNERVTLKSAMELLSAAYSLHASFGEAEIIDMFSGVRPAYPDNLPRITIDGHIIRCNGLFRHGFLLAPAMAACVADYIEGRKNDMMNLFVRENHEPASERTENHIRRRA